MSFRVIQWATGGVGRAAMEGVLAHPELELAGAWVHSANKEGADLGALLGRDDLGVTATNDVDALLATEADCVLYSPIFADPSMVEAILASGKNVVSPLGWFYPPPDKRQKFDAIAKEAGVTLHGTGINPGGITERFPLMISALSGSVTHVRAEEYSDIRTYGAPDVVRDWMLFGKTPEEARASVMIDALGGGFRQSLFMVADEMGFDVEPKLKTTHEMAVATAPIDSPIGPIQPGTVRRSDSPGRPPSTGCLWSPPPSNWLMGEEHLDPAWSFGPEGERFEVEITGDPNCLTTFKKLHPETVEAGLIRNPGVVATAMHCVNAIPYVCRAEPGLLTYLEMPLVAGRADPGLHRDRRAASSPTEA